MERWRDAWRNGVAPHLSTRGLEALRTALVEDDDRLVQGKTTVPRTGVGAASLVECRGGCAITFAWWQGHDLRTVGALVFMFECVCIDSDDQLDDRRGSWWFVRWFDRTPRPQMRVAFLAEVERELGARRGREAERLVRTLGRRLALAHEAAEVTASRA